MSHVAKIIAVKQTLLGMGFSDPDLQTAVTRTAYVRALASIRHQLNIEDKDVSDWLKFTLAYWNETYPVAGNLVIADLSRFSSALKTALMNLGSLDKLEVEVATFPEKPEGLDVVTVGGYDELVNQLKVEAAEQYENFKRYYLGE